MILFLAQLGTIIGVSKMINPVFLRTFVDLSKTKSFIGTAKSLHMTQPGVSQHLNKLEEYFDAKLVTRHGKQFELTNAGEKLLEYTKKLLDDHDRFLQALKKDDPHRGLCRFASPGSIGTELYSYMLLINKDYPNLSISYRYAPNSSIVDGVMSGEIDVGFVTKKPEISEIRATSFEKEKICLVTPRKAKIDCFSDLVKLGFVGHPDGDYHATRVLEKNYSKEFSSMKQFPLRGFSNQITRILEPVSLGLGFTALPLNACQAFPDQRSIKYLDLKTEVWDTIYRIQKKHRELASRFHFILSSYQKSGSKRGRK